MILLDNKEWIEMWLDTGEIKTNDEFEEAIDFLFENLNTGSFDDSYNAVGNYGLSEPNELIKITAEEKIDIFRDKVFEYIKYLRRVEEEECSEY
jgi:hypothetical protein